MDKLAFFVKFAIVLMVISAISMLMLREISEGFYLSLASFLMSTVVFIIGTIIIKRRKE